MVILAEPWLTLRDRLINELPERSNIRILTGVALSEAISTFTLSANGSGYTLITLKPAIVTHNAHPAGELCSKISHIQN